MKALLLPLMAVLILVAPNARAQQMTVPGYGPVELSRERIVLQTRYGDLVLALFPKIAPKHTRQILRLARGGLYDTTHFYRLEKGFVLQTSNVQDRLVPLTPMQQSLIHKIPAEFSRLPHIRGMLSMARWDDPNSAESSFSIMLGPAPHLNGKYTIFGALVGGFDVLAALENVSVSGTAPKERLDILKAEVVDASALPALRLRHAMQPAPAQEASSQTAPAVPAILGLIAFAAAMLFAFSKKLAPRHLASIALLIVLLSGFGLLIALTPLGHSDRRIAAALFIGLIGLFRLMNQFEAPG